MLFFSIATAITNASVPNPSPGKIRLTLDFNDTSGDARHASNRAQGSPMLNWTNYKQPNERDEREGDTWSAGMFLEPDTREAQTYTQLVPFPMWHQAGDGHYVKLLV